MLTALLIKPSKYDDDGYVVHHWKGVLPSNTLNCMSGLFRKAAEDLDLEVDIHLFDETVGVVTPESLMKRFSSPGIPTLVCLVGVQTNQFPRGADLAIRFRAAGAKVIMGGFHVSGSLSLLGITPELQALLDHGVSLFSGEAEGRLEEVLADALEGELKPVYESRGLPRLDQEWTIPLVDEKLAKRFILPYAGTLDTSRGCIFNCSFCTIIHVQGDSMRSRDPKRIEARIRQQYPRVSFYFFTDDNLARNPRWREIFEALIRLREEGMALTFMMQVDVPAYRIPGFVELAAAAGCSQVFIGLESLNPANLAAASKRQNRVDRYEEMMSTWRNHGIAVHASYIIGFEEDTVESVRRDLRVLMDEVRPDQASFFMLTPLPGSTDHRELIQRGDWTSPDFNEYDSFHAAAHHSKMTDEEWFDLYKEAWKNFYSAGNLKSILNRATPATYWSVFKNALWYAYAALCEEAHPMITGLWRLKGRAERRPSFPRESRWAYGWRRTRDSVLLLARIGLLVLTFEKIWRETWASKQSRTLGDSVAAAGLRHSERGRRMIARWVAWMTRRSLSLGESASVFRSFWGRLRKGQVWNPLLYWEGVRGAFLLACEVAFLGWLFLMNLSLET